MVYVYVLQLEFDKYYIGKTSCPFIRLENHFNLEGSVWTMRYKPIKLVKLIANCDDFDEDKWTLRYMAKYGINNVRGGSFCRIILNDIDKSVIRNMINGSTNRCYNCGMDNHFVKDCHFEHRNSVIMYDIDLSTINKLHVPKCKIIINDPNIHYAFRTSLFGYSTPSAHIEYSEQYMKPIIVSPFKILLRQGYLGKGKTYSCIEWIKKYNPKRVLYLSPRRLFARAITTELNNHLSGNPFTCYLDVEDKHGLIYYDRLVIQMESLTYLECIEDLTYDAIILDEIESLLKQFSSTKTMKNRLRNCTTVFEQLISTTPYVIGSDAFLTTRSLRSLRQINPNITIERNLHPPVKRKCLQYDNKNDFINTAIDSINTGKNIIMVWGSKDAMLKFENMYLHGKRYKIYYGGLPNNYMDDLGAVNEIWNKVQIVMYTAAITVGISFDLLYFDQLFVYGSCMSMSVRDLFQSMMRVRYLRDNIMHCYLQTTYFNPHSLLTIGEKYILRNLRKIISEPLVREFTLEKLWEIIPTWLIITYVLNKKEDAYTALHYQEVFNTYLVLCNYDKTIIQSFGLKLIDIDTSKVNYNQIQEIDDGEAEKIKKRIKNGRANEIERLELDKYIFGHLLITELPKEVRQVLYTESWTKGLKHKYIGCYQMKNKTIEDAFNKDLDNHYKVNSSMRELQLAEINKISDIMGLSNTGEGKTWNHDELMESSKRIMPDFYKECRLFQFKTKTRRTNVKGLTKVLLRKIYGVFTTSKLIEVRYQTRVNGKRVERSRLVKTPCYIMPCIKGSPIEQAPKTSEEMKQLMELSSGANLKKNKVPPDRARLKINTPRARIIIKTK